MDTNVSVSGGILMPESESTPSSASSPLEEFIPGEGGDDMNLEWLSIYVEDCLSATTDYSNIQPLPIPTTTTTNPSPQTPTIPKTPFQDPAIPAKPRSKRRRIIPRSLSGYNIEDSFLLAPSDPPLLQQTYWLADSELILPKKDEEEFDKTPTLSLVGEGGGGEEKIGKDGCLGQPRRCTHCLSHKTPQWRAGPLGPKTLCNACGVRFKSGRLLPEYRPAKSPTFVSYKHSNSHKKVMEMRTAILSSHSN
ncbi:GATA transcription factor 12-like [Typha angustifolia]|uniref:GATA transcription factor 12-like n=1 Tax=Typha angustifolia TaxID=59011 RepID=UPI003C2F0738